MNENGGGAKENGGANGRGGNRNAEYRNGNRGGNERGGGNADNRVGSGGDAEQRGGPGGGDRRFRRDRGRNRRRRDDRRNDRNARQGDDLRNNRNDERSRDDQRNGARDGSRRFERSGRQNGGNEPRNGQHQGQGESGGMRPGDRTFRQRDHESRDGGENRDRNGRRDRFDRHDRHKRNRDRFKKHGGRPGGQFDRQRRTDHRSNRERMDHIRELEKRFDRLTAVDPFEPFRFETVKDEMTTRIIDLFGPIGRGQRAMIVAPPKAGKTIMIQKLALALHTNHPDVRVLCLLVDERPEEVTDFKRSVPAEVIASCSDQTVDEHVRAVEDTFMAARESALEGKDVVVFIDSLTRLARAYNQYTESSGKTLTGGLDSAAMQRPRKFFGSARKIDKGGSLTVIATSLIETGSRMDDIIFQEFKGTGNTEIVLSRKLAEQRMFPALDLIQTSTRKEERLFPPDRLMRMRLLRRAIGPLSAFDAMLLLLDKITKFPSNDEFLKSIPVS